MMTTINLKSARAAILDDVARDIRRVAPALVEVTLPVAIENWNHFFQLGQYREAARWWALAHERMMQEGAN